MVIRTLISNLEFMGWKRAARWLVPLALVPVLSACGGGASTEENPVTSTGTVTTSSYNGPNALTEDIRSFQVYVWEKLNATNRCGACHIEGAQAPEFVRMDDVNDAYAAAIPLVDLENPAASRLATKVGTGHNCWLTSNAACAQLVTSYIEDWADGVSASAGRQIQLVAPVSAAPGETKTFPVPEDYAGFDPVWTILKTNCSGCHEETAPTPQSPFFASTVVADAYEAAKPKIDLNSPLDSRLVVRLEEEFHNCWSNCSDDADDMLAAITGWADTITADTVGDPIVFSDALRLPDGIVAAGGNRHEADQIALYEFKTGSGNVALDTSGVGAELNLTLSGNVDWVGGWGIQIKDGKAQGSTSASQKLYDLITATGEYSIEGWVIPGNVTQEGPARIISYSGGVDSRNFMLGQTLYNYNFHHRSSTTDGNGEPALSTNDDDEDLQAALQHVAVTFDPINGRQIYINGVHTDDVDSVAPGNLNDWDDSFALVLGNEVSNDRLWEGIFRMVAIHNRALTPEQIVQNFDVGVGEKFFLLFGLSHLISVPEAYIMFEVSQYDSYSYLFSQPTFISLDPDASPSGIDLQEMRIGINGKEALVGQAYRTLDTTLGGNAYDPATGQSLSDVGTIIALENGPENDEFFLTFEVLGGNDNVSTEPTNLATPDVAGPDPYSDVGVRTFDEVNATMAQITGVLPTAPNVDATYVTVRQQLPTVETAGGFLSAHQIGVAQLAIAYCDALVEDTTLRNNFFTATVGANPTLFGSGATINAAIQDNLAQDLFDNMAGLPGSGPSPAMTSNPSETEVKDELIGTAPGHNGGLFLELANICTTPGADPTCDATDTRTIAKGMCAAVLGSAVMLIQ